jgi:hypothetical protein
MLILFSYMPGVLFFERFFVTQGLIVSIRLIDEPKSEALLKKLVLRLTLGLKVVF